MLYNVCCKEWIIRFYLQKGAIYIMEGLDGYGGAFTGQQIDSAIAWVIQQQQQSSGGGGTPC